MDASPRDLRPTPTSEHRLDDALLGLARSQSGVLTTAQLLAAGHHQRGLCDLVGSGVLRHPGRGLYLVAALEEVEPEARHRQLCAAAFLLYPDAVLVGTSALLAHGITVWGADLGRPSLRRPIHRSGGMSAFWVRRAMGSVVESEWGPASPVHEALVQHAIDRGIVPGVVSADAALHESRTTIGQLEEALEGAAADPHGSRAVAMSAFADGRRESVGESRCAVAMAMAGIVARPQVEIRDGSFLVARVDFLVEGTKVVVEFDGKVKYADGDPRVLWDEKRREDRLRRLGYVVVRITWADLERPGAVAAKIRSALRAAN